MNITALSIRLTIFALLLSLVGSGYSDWLMLNEKVGIVAHGITVSKEPQSYSFVQGGRCIGRLNSQWAQVPDGVELRLQGEVFGDSVVQLDGQISFNPIGQCLGSVMRITGPQSKIVLGSKGIFDIEFIINASLSGKNFKFNFPVAGPIELIKGKIANTIIFPRVARQFPLVDSLHANPSFDALSSIQLVNEQCTNPSPLQVPPEILQSLGTLQSYGTLGGLLK